MYILKLIIFYSSECVGEEQFLIFAGKLIFILDFLALNGKTGLKKMKYLF
jgi:hypothetical protein